MAVVARAVEDLSAQLSIPQAMGALTSSIQDKEFPATVQDGPQPYATRTVTRQAEITLAYPRHTATQSKHAEEIYASPSGWAISVATRNEDYSNPPGNVDKGLTVVPGGFQLLTHQQFSTEFNSAKDLFAGVNIASKIKIELTAKLTAFVKNYQDYATSISASHGTVIHKATLTSTGFMSGVPARYHGWVDVAEVAVPLEIQNQGALKTTLAAWVKKTVDLLHAIPRPVDTHTIDVVDKPLQQV